MFTSPNNCRSFPAYALLGLMAIACSAGAQTVYPFSAESSGPFTISGNPPIVATDIFHTFSAASPFPLAVAVLHQNLNLSVQPFAVTDGILTLTAPTGDTLLGTYSGIVTLTGPLTFDIGPVPFVFTGGTGIFDGASGTGNITGNGAFSDATFSGGSSVLHWSGSITLVPEPGSLGLGSGLVLIGGILLKRRRMR